MQSFEVPEEQYDFVALLSMVLSMTFGVLVAAYGMGRYRVPAAARASLTFRHPDAWLRCRTPMYLIFNKLICWHLS